MDIIAWLGRIVFFLAALWLAMQNTATVPLRLSAQLHWDAVPLVAIILACFVAGVLAGTLALMPRLVGLRRRVAHQQARRARDTEASTVEIALRAARHGGAVGEVEPEPRSRR